MLPTATLSALLERDPDGWTVQPQRGDYTTFRLWAIATYGRTAWNLYIRQHAA